ncbi:hypothetical protein [Actinokineospora fastidiosa]|uniref:Uncharacterized protein n=1 Tax=Actinokineospora fastidiosa TaxID=1816 RepID=A0A918GQB1_9PSEU|nr:hypothetical protein [Actinokineospora fastidiosa]GGS52080.1 hypothetical protein GCM10010171_53930 [Actinokineospora fastidiosa]
MDRAEGRWPRRVAVAATVASLCLAAPLPAAAIDDAQIVYCLGKDQRDALREAAVALGKAADTAALADIAAWRGRDAAAFEETCEALYEAAKPQPGAFADALPFLTALVGALLAYFAALGQERRMLRRRQADALRAALAEFDAAARHYTHVLAGDRPVERLRAAHGALVGRLAEARAEYPDWRLAADCHERLTAGDLGMDELTSGWNADKDARAKAVRGVVTELHAGVQRIAAGLLRPRRRNPDRVSA